MSLTHKQEKKYKQSTKHKKTNNKLWLTIQNSK